MKTTIVPAQITTVEDKITRNLNFTQLLLLTTPVFMSGVIFTFLPPYLRLSSYKLVICFFLTTAFFTLAIRIRGKIILTWISIVGRYNLRPRYYLFNKNDSYLRSLNEDKVLEVKQTKNEVTKTVHVAANDDIPLTELVRLEGAVSNPKANFHLKTTRKGGLRVYIQEVK